ncbi:hypothetical protein M0R45_020172 [Rubus argutus]|uniref:Uncharacterized protein n=1 Tax=Rubus argutus TaxID=59490 RepID=A0AAW1XAT7_RUBAR
MDVLSWNCRGMGMDSKMQALKDLISQNRPSGGLGLFWRDEVKLRVQSSSARFIDAELDGNPGDSCHTPIPRPILY